MAIRSRFPSFRRLSTAASAAGPLLWSHAGEETAAPSATVQILSWGRGSSGQLGGGKEEIRFYPAPVASLRLPPDFRLAPVQGRLALPLPSQESATAAASVEVGISCGLFHSALLVDGRFWIWGKGDGGRLGFGDESSVFVPTLNPNIDGVRSISLGGIHSTALTRSGEVFTWSVKGSFGICLIAFCFGFGSKVRLSCFKLKNIVVSILLDRKFLLPTCSGAFGTKRVARTHFHHIYAQFGAPFHIYLSLFVNRSIRFNET